MFYLVLEDSRGTMLCEAKSQEAASEKAHQLMECASKDLRNTFAQVWLLESSSLIFQVEQALNSTEKKLMAKFGVEKK